LPDWRTRGVEAEVGDEPVGAVEAAEVADGGEDGDRDGDVYPGQGHQPRRDVAVDLGELLAVEVELPQQRLDAAPLVPGRSCQSGQRRPTPGRDGSVRSGEPWNL
jgi:hypothetical protein